MLDWPCLDRVVTDVTICLLLTNQSFAIAFLVSIGEFKNNDSKQFGGFKKKLNKMKGDIDLKDKKFSQLFRH